MKRTPFIVTGTIVGLAGVLSFRSTPAKISLASAPTSAVANGVTASSPPTTTGTGASNAATTTPARPATTPTTSPSATTTPARPRARAAASVPTTRSATGPSVNYYFGVLSVSVTATGTHVKKVTIHSINDGGNPLSQSIDHQSIPQLEQQALAAQNSNIQGVSGASYTSAGFKMSLQGALGQLGLK